MSERGIEPLAAGDARAISQLVAPALGPTWSLASILEELSRPGAMALGLRQEHGLAGALLGWVVAKELEISVVVVVPERRRQGIGRALVEAALDRAGRAGARQAFLEVRSKNTAARELYATLGFEEMGLRRAYYANGEDAVSMSRTIG